MNYIIYNYLSKSSKHVFLNKLRFYKYLTFSTITTNHNYIKTLCPLYFLLLFSDHMPMDFWLKCEKKDPKEFYFCRKSEVASEMALFLIRASLGLISYLVTGSKLPADSNEWIIVSFSYVWPVFRSTGSFIKSFD